MRFIFVGEKRSDLAEEKNWRWEDGQLAAKQLFDALRDNHIIPERHIYVNLLDGSISARSLKYLQSDGYIIVGMGKKVQSKLTEEGIPHTSIIHPAARGTIRKKENYSQHIKEQLVWRKK